MSNLELIKELRSLTQAGMKDCKDALEESNWNLQKAVDLVKVKGLNVVSGREGKVASEGVVVLTEDSRVNSPIAMVEVNCQTDFVARSVDFMSFAYKTAYQIVKKFEADEPFTIEDVEDERKEVVSTTKENVVVRRWWVEQPLDSKARTFTYLHSNNKIGVMITLLAPTEDAAKDLAFRELGNDLAMQVAAMSPLSVSQDKLDADIVARQRGIFEQQLVELNKPQAAWAKILEGKFNKWYTEVCLENQESVVVPKTSVAQVIKNVGTKLGGEVQVVNFIRCQVGEGLDQSKEQLADEVAKML